jgi:hypothetical protein
MENRKAGIMENHKAKLAAEMMARIGFRREITEPILVRAKTRPKRQHTFRPRRNKGRPRPPGAASGPTIVYFVQADDGLVKIGTTKNMRNRLHGLVNGVDGTFNILAMTPGDWLTEQSLHSRFQAHWAHGEWFRPAPEILSLADQLRDLQRYQVACGQPGG